VWVVPKKEHGEEEDANKEADEEKRKRKRERERRKEEQMVGCVSSSISPKLSPVT